MFWRNKKKYSYKLRPGYGSHELLIEFFETGDADRFFDFFHNFLEKHNYARSGFSDLWMNDQIIIHFKSNVGHIEFVRDVWDNFFVHAENNQEDILRIDGLMLESGLFEKLEMNPGDYRLPQEKSK